MIRKNLRKKTSETWGRLEDCCKTSDGFKRLIFARLLQNAFFVFSLHPGGKMLKCSHYE